MTPSPEMLVRATKVFEEITLDLCDDDEIKKIIAAALQQVHDEAVKSALAVVNEQAEDDGLWFKAEYFTENYLQRALRRLHSAVEGTKP